MEFTFFFRYNLLLECWSVEPLDRPTFSMCADRLGILMLPDLREVLIIYTLSTLLAVLIFLCHKFSFCSY